MSFSLFYCIIKESESKGFRNKGKSVMFFDAKYGPFPYIYGLFNAEIEHNESGAGFEMPGGTCPGPVTDYPPIIPNLKILNIQ